MLSVILAFNLLCCGDLVLACDLPTVYNTCMVAVSS